MRPAVQPPGGYRPAGPNVSPPTWLPPRRPIVNPAVGVVIVVLFAFVVTLVVVFLATGGLYGGFAPVLFLPGCGLGIALLVVLIVVAVSASQRSSLPPPPPIQQPMVPAGLQGPISLSCPNCGAPPESIDRFGVATCTHCATRFLVR